MPLTEIHAVSTCFRADHVQLFFRPLPYTRPVYDDIKILTRTVIDRKTLRLFACGLWNETLRVTRTDLHFMRAGYVCGVRNKPVYSSHTSQRMFQLQFSFFLTFFQFDCATVFKYYGNLSSNLSCKSHSFMWTDIKHKNSSPFVTHTKCGIVNYIRKNM